MNGSRTSRFEEWNLAEPPFPRLTSLYSLSPCGVGTAYVESLSSYVTRLAEAHVVPVWRLLLHVAFSPEKAHLGGGFIRRTPAYYAHVINGIGAESESVLHAFEAASGKSDLYSLTLSFLKDTIMPEQVFRNTEAWCPACLEHWRIEEATIYTPLLWMLRVITICPKHHAPLVDCCPHCRSRFRPLKANAKPGHCSTCSQWLGDPLLGMCRAPSTDDCDDLWIARTIGEVLATIPELQGNAGLEKLQSNLHRCLSQTPAATRRYFARLAGGDFAGWISITHPKRPPLARLCRLSCRLKLPLKTLLEGVPNDWRGPKFFEAAQRARRRNHQQRAYNIRQALLKALRESPPPTVIEVARRVNLGSHSGLSHYEPDLCKQLAARRRILGIPKNHPGKGYKHRPRQKVESALRNNLKRNNPQTLTSIASSLGYARETPLRRRFPQLCDALIEKRQRYRRQELIRRFIEKAKAGSPPPSIRDISRKGIVSLYIITKYHPHVISDLKEWRKAWFRNRRAELRLSVRKWVAEKPQPTIAKACLYFGISAATFRNNFPEERSEVLRISRAQAESAREQRRLALHKEVHAIVSKMREHNTYPSLPAVQRLLPAESLRSLEMLRPAINAALAQLSNHSEYTDRYWTGKGHHHSIAQ